MTDISHAQTVVGWMSPVELTWLAETAAKIPKGGKIVEIGSYKGRSACALAANTDATIYCVDIWTDYIAHGSAAGPIAVLADYDEFCRNAARYNNIVPVNNTSVLAAQDFASCDERFDLVFLDADHTAEHVRQDILAWRPLLAKYSVFAGHDYDFSGWPDVKRVVDELIPGVGVVGTIWIAP